MIHLIFAGLLATAEPSAVDVSSRTEALAALPAGDFDIQRALWAAYQANPDKNVCVTRTLTGSHQKRQVCGTLQQWFTSRVPEEISRKEPPRQLVEGVKEERRKALARNRSSVKRGAGG